MSHVDDVNNDEDDLMIQWSPRLGSESIFNGTLETDGNLVVHKCACLRHCSIRITAITVFVYMYLYNNARSFFFLRYYAGNTVP